MVTIPPPGFNGHGPRVASMRWQLCGAALLVCAWLTGCSVGPAYKRPDIALPAQWHESARGSTNDSDGANGGSGGSGASNGDGADPRGSGATGAVWPAAEWWHGFGSAQLDELIAEAQRSNDDLAGAMARV